MKGRCAFQAKARRQGRIGYQRPLEPPPDERPPLEELLRLDELDDVDRVSFGVE
ncbi:hypothetical protein [Myxococcus vastator]|uniref:hypothetical protein n=1 Tax=Myxococcus vastator TaxID=2709664 RepID=UPI001967DB0A|nr:hypothetical protein [Myxococcus vastator]